MGWIIVMMEWATVLDIIRGITKTSRTGVELTIDSDMSQAVAMEAHFIKARMVQG